jgi:GNAT superfamily N-acetyltransferase
VSLGRIRAVWASLAGAAQFPASGPAVVVVNAESRICPPGWAGVVALEGGVLATVPHPDLVEPFTRALGAFDWAADWLTFGAGGVRVVEARGPASLAYVDSATFVPPAQGQRIEPVDGGSARAGRFIASVPTADAEEAGIESCPSPWFCVADGDDLVAAAGYRVWLDELAHLSVLVAPEARGRGRGRAVAGAATEHALSKGLIGQWRAVPAASRAVAAALGYEPRGRQVSIRLA